MPAPLRWISAWLEIGLNRLIGSLMAVLLSLSLALTACSGAGGAAGPLSGIYLDDTLAVASSLLSTITLTADDPSRAGAETEAQELIKSYMARYRARRDVNGLASFTTMQTALNSLASHYVGYPNRPLPDDLRARLAKELKQAEVNVERGA